MRYRAGDEVELRSGRINECVGAIASGKHAEDEAWSIEITRQDLMSSLERGSIFRSFMAEFVEDVSKTCLSETVSGICSGQRVLPKQPSEDW